MVNGMRRLFRGALFLLFIALGQTSALASDHRAGDLLIEHLWSPPTPPAVSVGVVYFSIDNRGRKGDRLIEITSPVAARVEMHETRTRGGTMEMRPVSFVECPPGVTVKSESGGLHVMLTGLSQPLAKGVKFPLRLRFRDAGAIDIQVPVGNPE
jgi:periplasmic copper chaperone A